MDDIWDDDTNRGRGGTDNSLKLNAEFPFSKYQHYFVRSIALRGTGWDGSHHQELMIELGQTIPTTLVRRGYLRYRPVLLRISRNNGQDTFQLGASASKYNTLLERHVSRNTITCRRVFQAFGEVRKLYPSYDKGNCRRFAQDIFEALVPEVTEDFEKESGGRGSNLDEIRDLFF
ncbi:hypothetical protein IHE49_03515 [Rhodanobacter sp. 7MK24]|uniref:hypothetical protein n=1 Tax=Rhodanobacter sp. 7MK24 TaxID=2775922 RepID=UPI001780A01D|nr:hypothetical protein [Rhodanobacter sp. 7MK24]MBD8879545.1 hypothetical protein [Rhodanobacter sp. 7MK24]